MIYLEDVEAGPVGTFGAYQVSAEEIIDFGERYNPLAYHVDPDVAGPFGGVVATGWQVGAIMMRLATDAWIGGMASLGGTGVEARFRKPVRPGDELRVQVDVLDVTPSARSEEYGTVRWCGTLLNQHEECALTCNVTMRVGRRPR